jgi:type I restriction enzyme, R subunit
MSAYTEDTLVQQTTAAYLREQLGWQSIYAYNNEGFGTGSLLGRASDREVVLTRTLRTKLKELNAGLPDAAYDEAIRQITATVASQSLIATNREKYELIRNGVQVSFRNDKGELVRDRLRLFDFDLPARNDFLCVRELWVRGDLYRRRADIVGFVNGLPLLFIECKNIHRNLKTAFERIFSDYKVTVPHLFHHNAIVMFGNGDEAKIGSITSKCTFWPFTRFHGDSWRFMARQFRSEAAEGESDPTESARSDNGTNL